MHVNLQYLRLQNMFPEILSIMSMLSGFLLPNVAGYIDPGSASLVIQIIIGVLVGVGITLKLYWYKLKSMVSHIIKKDD